MSVASLGFAARTPYFRDIAWGGIFVLGAHAIWRHYMLSYGDWNPDAIPQWWRSLWRGVIAANVVWYFVFTLLMQQSR